VCLFPDPDLTLFHSKVSGTGRGKGTQWELLTGLAKTRRYLGLSIDKYCIYIYIYNIYRVLLCGVIPRAVKDIFNYIRENVSTEYLVKAAFVELYNEKLRDLLANKTSRLVNFLVSVD